MEEGSQLRQERLRKLKALRQMGLDPYPAKFSRTHHAAQLHKKYDVLNPGERTDEEVRVAGRIMSIRRMGKVSFLDIKDQSGRIQLYASQNLLNERYKIIDLLDRGDFIGTWGVVFRTRMGELSVEMAGFEVLSKSLRPLPEKWHGLKDTEIRYRKRYLDLMQEGVREIFLTRTKVLKAMRRFLDERGFMEVETPILQPIYGGASAKPFETHHLALNQRMYLRISDELYLKRLIIGGIERVYEIGKDFRNEGVSTVHNPEFTQMECYQAYADYHEMMKLTEEMIYFVAQQAIGKTQIVYQGRYIDLAPPWERVTLRDVILNRIGIDIEADLEGLSHQIKEKSLDIEGSWGEIVDGLLKEIESSLGFGKDPKNPGKPIFVMDYPVEISPLAKRKPQSEFTERFEVFVGGIELGNAFSELNDPLEQRERFSAQEELRLKGDEEAHLMDEDFIVALEHGMPPTGGLGIGVDRLVMLLVDSPSIREVMLFPQLRAKT